MILLQCHVYTIISEESIDNYCTATLQVGQLEILLKTLSWFIFQSICVLTRRPIEGRIIHALGKTWHPEVRQ